MYFLSSSLYAQTISEKRGIAYGEHSPADLNILSNGISWWYNQNYLPDLSIRDIYKSSGVEFVPMLSGESFNLSAVNEFLEANEDIGYLLGYNDSVLTPNEAAAQWAELEVLHNNYGLDLIGPVVNFCLDCEPGDPQVYEIPISYLDEFFAACSNCEIDFIAINFLGCGDVNRYLERFKKYNKPIWVTQIACLHNETVTSNQQRSHLINTVDKLENDPDVARYAWYTGRGAGFHTSLLDEDGKLTQLGKIYLSMPVHDSNEYVTVPARLEAENYQKMQGIELELAYDRMGVMNLGYTDSGDWVEYNISVDESKTYVFDLRIAGLYDGSFDLLLDEEYVRTVDVDATGGWQRWFYLEDSLPLTAGNHKLRFEVNQGGFNINWIDIFGDRSERPLDVESKKSLLVFPNPVRNGQIFVQSPSAHLLESSVAIFDLSGRQKELLEVSDDGEVLSLNLGSDFAPGVYLLEINTPKGTVQHKIVVE